MALFVGPKHSGKTVSACSVYSDDPTKRTKVLDGDGRIRGILGAPWIDKSRIDYDYFPPRVGPQGQTFYERVNQALDALIVQCNTGQSPYETFLGDSLTAITSALVLDAVPLTHAGGKGKKLGTLAMPGPEDYGFEATGTYSLLSCLRSLPIKNVILTAHVVDKYGKPKKEDGTKDTYADSIVVGEKLSLRDKISANIGIYFDHIFRFDREMLNGQEHFYVEFIGDIACTSFSGLKPGYHDITGKNFWKFLMEEVKGEVNAK